MQNAQTRVAKIDVAVVTEISMMNLATLPLQNSLSASFLLIKHSMPLQK